MDIDVFFRNDLPTVFRVLRTALRPSGLLESRERLFLDTYARINELALAGADPLPVSAEDVRIEGAHQRKRLVQLSAVAALFNSPMIPGSAGFVRGLSRHLGAYDPVLDILSALERKQFLKV